MLQHFSRGDRVVDPLASDRAAVVLDGPTRVGTADFYLILSSNGEEALYSGTDLRPAARRSDSPVGWLTERSLADPEHLSRFTTHVKLTAGLTDIVYSFSSTRTIFRVHQFKPVLKLIDAAQHRLLLADEVGLGKTIEAGLVWAELDARVTVQRVLVLCPSGLRQKWQIEMRNRFDRDMEVVDRSRFLDFVDRYHERGDATRFFGISSFSQLRSQDVLDTMSRRPPTFDLVIVDEAHAFRNPETRTHQLGELLADNTDGLLFLSATPVNLGSRDLFNLLRLLRPDEFSNADLFEYQLEPNIHINAAIRFLRSASPAPLHDVTSALRKVEKTRQAKRFLDNPVYRDVLVQLETADPTSRRDVVELQRSITSLNTLSHLYTRTRKRELKDQPAVRRAHTIEVELTAAESALYSAVVELVTALRHQATGVASALAAIMPARQASSCLPVMRDYLRQLQATGRAETDMEEGEEDIDDASAVAVGVGSRARALLAQAEGFWEGTAGIDTKFDQLVRTLRDLHSEGAARKVLVFSFFRRTLSYLEVRLWELGIECLRMDGQTPVREREEIMAEFRTGTARVLLSSEIGSEGLDFEFCDTIVNYDLPWNPMRLEQRIGRLDRFGQRNPVIHVVNFSIPDTIDTEIFFRLYARIGIFEHSIGELEPILGERVQEINRALATGSLTTSEQRRLVDAIALAVDAERSELERFEETRERLVGADSFVEDALDEARRENRYVTPAELARYVGGFLREEASPARLDAPTPGSPIRALMGSPGLAEHLRKHGSKWASPAFFELVASLEARSALPVAFDAEGAMGHRAEFLNMRHPIVRSIAQFYESNPDAQARGGYARIPHERERGSWIFFAFVLTATGVVPRTSMMAVAWERAAGRVDVDLGTEILRYLAGDDVPRMQERDIPILEAPEAELAYSAVLSSVGEAVEALREELTRRNEALVAARQDSLRHGLEIRTSRLRQLAAQQASDSPIRRMRLAQAVNEEQRTEAELAKLEGQRQVTVGFRAVAGGLVDFVAKP